MRRVFVYEHVSGGGLGPVTCTGPAAAEESELLGAGLAMRDALVADLLACDGLTVTVASGLGVPAPPLGAITTRPRQGEPGRAFVALQALLHDAVWVIAPETDDLLADLQAEVPAQAWQGCSAPAIRLASRKQATLCHLARHGVRTPLRMADGVVRRWVVKPDDGAGALATWCHEDLRAALADQARRAACGAASSLEPWVEGEALSLSLLIGHGGWELLSVNRQQISVDAAGRVGFEGVQICALGPGDPRHPALAALAAQVVAAMPGLHGFVGIDCVWHARDGAVLIEVNPRLTCAYVGLSAALGRNLAADWLGQHSAQVAGPLSGREPDHPAVATAALGALRHG